MHFFVFHILIGSAIAYFMQPQIKWVAERVTRYRFLQAMIKILLDALMAVSWIIIAPAILIAKYNMKPKDETNDRND